MLSLVRVDFLLLVQLKKPKGIIAFFFLIQTLIVEFFRAYFYCEFCHKDVTNLQLIKKCKCHFGKSMNQRTFFFSFKFKYYLACQKFKRGVRAVIGIN
jgi:hypothetical protein